MGMNKFMVEPSPIKRIASYFLDLMLSLVIGFVLFATLGQHVIAKGFGAEEASKNANSFAISSGLAKPAADDKGADIYIYQAKGENGAKNGYEGYLNCVWHYYTEFLNVAKNPDERVVARTNSDGKEFTSDDYYRYFFEKCMGFVGDYSKSNPFFVYAKEGDKILLTSKPVLNDEYQAKVDAGDETALQSLLSYFYNETTTSQTGLYFDALRDMKGKSYSSTSVQTYYEEQLTRYSYALWGGEVLCLAPITIIFFLVLPLCLKDGQSLGKFLMKVKVVDSRGFNISTTQKIIRPIIVTVIHLLALIPNATLGIMIYLAIAITSFFMMSLGKKRMNLHERITKTIVVDKKASIIFKDEHEKSLYLEKHNLDENGNPLMKISEVEGEPRVNLTKEEEQ